MLRGTNMSKLVMSRMLSYSNVAKTKKYVYRHQRKANNQYELRNTPIDIIAAYSPMRKINDINFKKKKKMNSQFCISPIPPIVSHCRLPEETNRNEVKDSEFDCNFLSSNPMIASNYIKIKSSPFKNNEVKINKTNLSSIARKYKNKRQNSLLTVVTKTTSKYYTARQSDIHNKSIEKIPSF